VALEIDRLSVGYESKPVIHDLSWQDDLDSPVSILGHNGSGKSTLIKAVAGLLSANTGSIQLNGIPIDRKSSSEVARLGVRYVPQDQGSFRDLSVLQNIDIARIALRRKPELSLTATFERVWSWFPALEEKRAQKAGTLSGGERKMVAISMALLQRPTLLILDEPSVGLAPHIIDDVYGRLQSLNDELGFALIIAEQNVSMALAHSLRTVVLRAGQIAWQGSSEDLRQRGPVFMASLL
jgi:branched-chain amino acid transport system ATP-binding protein